MNRRPAQIDEFSYCLLWHRLRVFPAPILDLPQNGVSLQCKQPRNHRLRMHPMTYRHVYMVLSPRSLSYARDALESLFGNSVEDLHLRLITDSEQDKEELTGTLQAIDSKTH